MSTEDVLDYTGLQLKDNSTLLSEIQTSWQNIYSPSGEPINFTSASPDGNITEILAEMGTAVRELITEVYNCGDPSKCNGAVQDKMYQINYLTRRAGTYTRQNINITVNKTVTLQGLDGSYNDPNASAYAVADDSGNTWYLIDTTTLYAGTTSCPFRAKEIGEVIPTVGTITNQVTIVGGVTNVINAVGYTILGTEQESDADFRIRRELSTANKGSNNEDSIVSQILALDGVTACVGHTNRTNTNDSTGTAAHTLWMIVGGGANTDIAEIIYTNLGGAGTRGAVSVTVPTASGNNITINFDRPTIVPLYIKFDLQVIGDLGEIDQNAVKEYIATNLKYNVGEDAETSKITQVCADAILNTGGGAYAVNVEISTGGTTQITTTSTSISDVVVSAATFQTACEDTAGSYVFTYASSSWQLSGDDVDIADYGITYTGTPVTSDTITVVYTASVWKDFIAAATIATQYVVDATRISINAVE